MCCVYYSITGYKGILSKFEIGVFVGIQTDVLVAVVRGKQCGVNFLPIPGAVS